MTWLLTKPKLSVAEQLKIFGGTAMVKGLTKRDVLDLSEFGSHEKEEVSRKLLAQIIEARVEEILEKVGSELKQIGRAGVLPAGAVFVGGGSKLHGLIDVAKRDLRLPASLGYPLNVTSVTDKINDVVFAIERKFIINVLLKHWVGQSFLQLFHLV